jgi:glyoxylase I family protein
VPSIKAIGYVGLSVRDAGSSAGWYRRLLDMREAGREDNPGWISVLLEHPSGFAIGLIQHRTNDGQPFSEFRTGLDHVEFEVESEDELNAWRSRLDELGIAYTGAFPHIVTFRDPDNIQLEFFCSGGIDAQ